MKLFTLFALLLFCLLACTYTPLRAQAFTDVTSTAFPVPYQNARIIAVMDYNNDNLPDLFFRYSPDGVNDKYTILENKNGVYTDVGASLNCPNAYARFFDFNNDGYVDMAAFSGDTISIYENNAGKSFSLYSTITGVPTMAAYNRGSDGEFGLYDYDNDGDLDFIYTDSVVPNSRRLIAIVNDYQHGNFSQKAVLINTLPVNGTRFKMFDMDNDGDLDVVGNVFIDAIGFNTTPMFLYKNDGHGNFTDITATSGLTPNQCASGCDIFDINQDGKPDIIRGGDDAGSAPLYRVFINNGDGTFTDETNSYAIKPASCYEDKFNAVDFDNDGNMDYNWTFVDAVGNGTNKLYQNNGSNSFTEVSSSYRINLGTVNGNCCPIDNLTNADWLDYNNDGSMDVFVSREKIHNTKNGIAWMMKNPIGGNYLNIRLVGCISNREGRGAKIVARINGKDAYQYYIDGANTIFENSTSIFHFGLGGVTTLDSVTVYWPSGIITRLAGVQGNTLLTINELPGGVMFTVSPASASFCSGQSVTLSAKGNGLNYSWSPATGLNNATGDTVIASPLVTTTYTVTGSAGSCSATQQVTVTIGSGGGTVGTITALRDTICQGTHGILNLSGNSSNVIAWQSSVAQSNFTDINGANSANLTTTPLSQSTCYRALVGSGSCAGVSDTLCLFVPPLLSAKFGYTQSGSVVTFLDSSLGNIITYHWDFGDGASSLLKNPVHTYAKSDTPYYACLSIYDGSNCSYTYCKYISVATGIKQLSISAGGLSVYPNPVGSVITIKANRTLTGSMYTLTDMLGRVVLNGKLTDEKTTLTIESLSAGMYILRVSGQENTVFKVIKE